MSPPVVVSVEPSNLETDVILGIPIIISFDQVIDPTTVNDATFALTGPGTSQHNLVSPSFVPPNSSRAPAASARDGHRLDNAWLAGQSIKPRGAVLGSVLCRFFLTNGYVFYLGKFFLLGKGESL